ncbi:MAG: LysR family transcriptional regulator [Enhydrobacter sp.]|nr:MAG: LysR family transcriptional regulator [Enhydrobacter sp.]
MNLAFLRYFLALAETSSFTAAAQRCHVTQPTLSAGIARLEEEVGGRLVDRGRPATLTVAGQRLLPHARAMIEEWRQARAEQRSSPRQRLVRIAVGSTLAVGEAMRWIAEAQRRVSFDVEISEGTADAVRERWRRGRCDVALFASRETPLDDNALSLVREPYVLAAASSHRQATRDRWSVRELADAPFILRAACEAHDDAQKHFSAEGVRPRVVLRSSDEERCAEAVLAGLGVSLMPRSLLRAGMEAAEIREVVLERRVILAWRSNAESEIASAVRDAAAGDDRLAFVR